VREVVAWAKAQTKRCNRIREEAFEAGEEALVA
jgi:hypothetical protein